MIDKETAIAILPPVPACVFHDDGTVNWYGREKENVAGRIVPDGNNPWIVVKFQGREIANRFGWSAVLAALNDPTKADRLPIVYP